MRNRRTLRRASFAGAGLCGLIALVGPALAPARADDLEQNRPTAFIANGNAIGIQQLFNTVPEQAVAEIINAKSPVTSANFEAGSTSDAYASLFDPGLLVTGGASLLCTAGLPCAQFPGFPPPYPLAARGNTLNQDSTATANGDTVAVGPTQTSAGDARVHAGRDKVTADAVDHGNAFGPSAQPIATTGSSFARNKMYFDGEGRLVSESISGASDINAGGALHIDSVESHTVSRANGAGKFDNQVTFDIQGATLGGVPIAIGDKGVNFGGNAQGGDALGGIGTSTSPLLQTVRGSVRTLGTSKSVDDSGASASVNGLLIELFPATDSVTGVSPKLTMIIGVAGSHAYAFQAPDVTFPTPTTQPGTTVGGIDQNQGGGSEIPGTPGNPGEVIPGTPGTPGRFVGGSSNTGGGLAGQLIGSINPYDLKWFYLAWTLSLIGCALGSRLNLARLARVVTHGGTR